MTVSTKDNTAPDVQLAHKHVADLSALTVHPGYLPVDGLCLEELCRWDLIQRVPRGYALTTRGDAVLAATELEHFQGLFADGSEKAGGAARPEIWTDRAGFETARTNAHDAALELAAVTDPAAFPAAAKKLGDACGGCHTKYRADY